MKNFKLSAIILGLLFVSGTAFAYNEPGYEGWDNKSKYAQASGQETQTVTLEWVRFSSQAQNGPSIQSGDSVVMDTNSDDGVSINLTTASADSAFAGIAVVAILTSDSVQNSASDGVGRRNWGWILVHGKTSAKVTAGGTNGNAVGDRFITSTDSGAITFVPAQLSVGDRAFGLAKGGNNGFFLDAADASSTLVDVYVQAE